MSTFEINKRYTELAESDCCLSCGSAVQYAEPLENEICIDLGSGRGTDAIRMAEKVGLGGYIYGIDISEGMIEKARMNAEKFKVSNIKFIQSNLEKIDLPDELADLVISNCTINHAENKQNVWNEVFRVLRAGGRFVVSDIYAVEPVPPEYKNDQAAIAECWAGSVTREEYLKNLEIAGFNSIKIIEESAPYSKGKIMVSSWTIQGRKPFIKKCCCCS